MSNNCPVCKNVLKEFEPNGGQYLYNCPRCGRFSLTDFARDDLEYLLERSKKTSVVLSHAFYKASRREKWPCFTSEQIEKIVKSSSIGSLEEQLENLIQWVGDNQPSPGISAAYNPSLLAAVGSEDDLSVGFICDYAHQRGLIENQGQKTLASYSFGPTKLTFDGWAFLEKVKHGESRSRLAFMAMKFGDDELDNVYQSHFKEAVRQTGFSLRRLDEDPKAGLIDDRLRVEIRKSKFLVADLTHRNNGAYWEAGYAEGLGKQVIYTCRKDEFDNQTVHFDTNHHLIVIWETGRIEQAVQSLKDTIRATFPDEAQMTDSN